MGDAASTWGVVTATFDDGSESFIAADGQWIGAIRGHFVDFRQLR
jgi:hypothetical protein